MRTWELPVMPVRCKSACANHRHFLLSLKKAVAALGLIIAAVIVHAMPVQADESYVCEGGRIVSVRLGELEKLALTDPCIAQYVARRSGAPATQPEAAELASTNALAAGEVAIPLPERKPANLVVLAAQTPPHSATEIIIHHEAPPTGEAEALQARVKQVSFRRASHHYYSNDALPTGPVDFRNVPIINAAPGEVGVFRHSR